MKTEMTKNTQVSAVILFYGVKQLKDFVLSRTNEVSGDIDHYSQLDIIIDEIEEMVSDPLDTIQDRVGYAEDLEEDNDWNLTPLQSAIVEASQDQELWENLNKDLKLSITKSKEYKVLIEEWSKAYSKF